MSYTAVMGGVDIIVFTGGIGESSSLTRQSICRKLDFINLNFDFEKNAEVRGQLEILTKEDSPTKVLVVPTDEELVIVRETMKLLDHSK